MKLEFNRENLHSLKKNKFLTKRIFKRISENMHYEIFKYTNKEDLLEIKGLCTGGYQLTTNKLLRSRIKNYFQDINFAPDLEATDEINRRNIYVIFEQMGRNKLSFESMGVRDKGLIKFSDILKLATDIEHIDLSNGIYIYIYIREQLFYTQGY